MKIFLFDNNFNSLISRACKNFLRFLLILIPYAWHIIFFIIPILLIFKMSFSESIISLPPYTSIVKILENNIINIKLNLGNYIWIFKDRLYLDALWESLKIASIATLGGVLIGYPIAYGIAINKGVVRIILLILVMLPFWTSFLIRVYAWIGLLGDHGIINNFLLWMHIINQPLPFLENSVGTVIGLIYSYLPFMVLPLYSSLEKIDWSYLEAAYDLGCKPIKAFIKIIIPLSIKGMLGGAMLIFIPAIGEFIVPTLLGGDSSMMIGKVLWNEFFIQNDWPLAASLVIILFVALSIPVFICQKLIISKQELKIKV